MTYPARRTLIVPDRLAARGRRLHAARTGQHGVQVMEVAQMAARLAGGFVLPIDTDSLRLAVQDVLPVTGLGELDAIKSLPGMVNAATRTLEQVWQAGIDLQARADDHPRIAALAALEPAVLAQLPVTMLRPAQIAEAALERIAHAPAVLGSVDIDGLADVAPCWHGLLRALAPLVPMRWLAGVRAPPAWVASTAMEVVRSAPAAPVISVVSAATPAHEALEAMRWMRQLLASGAARVDEIAIAAADPAQFDAHLLALAGSAGIDLHFVQGVPVSATREGQATCALADILVRGLSHARLRRLAGLCDRSLPLWAALPEQWLRVLPSAATLTSPQAWASLLARLSPSDWPGEIDGTVQLAVLVDLLQQGPRTAEAAGEQLLQGRALAIWRRALAAGPAASLMATLESMKQDDGLDPCASAAWMPAAALAGTPRRFVRLLGLNAGQWPRMSSDDALLPDHVVANRELEPLPLASRDAADYKAVIDACAGQVVISYSRRNDEGRRLGKSPLLAARREEERLSRHATTLHAISDADRLAARPVEFRDLPGAIAAQACWRNWQHVGVTAHDGAVTAGHPLIAAIAGRTHSASSLKLLLRNPLGYLWEYGLGLTAPEMNAEPLLLDAAASGNLVHEILDVGLQNLAEGGDLAHASAESIDVAVLAASGAVASAWASNRQLPPAVIWRRALDESRRLAATALRFGQADIAGMASFGEVAFGGAPVKSGTRLPWDAGAEITIPGTSLRIKGYIDRLDISSNGKQAMVCDYKTGKALAADVVINGGAELQRCLYAYAVKAMLGAGVAVRTSLFYPREQMARELAEPDAVMLALTGHLVSAYTSLLAGHCLPGPDTGGTYDKYTFLLPANALATYNKRKAAAIHAVLGDAATVWESK